jgi:hypothetical protein
MQICNNEIVLEPHLDSMKNNVDAFGYSCMESARVAVVIDCKRRDSAEA